MGLLTFGINLTLDGCCDHAVGIADDELHDYFTGLMKDAGAMLWGRVTYEMMESHWPAVARDEKAPRAERAPAGLEPDLQGRADGAAPPPPAGVVRGVPA